MATHIDLHALKARYGGDISGSRINIPTPGHSSRDRGTTITLVPEAPDGILVHSRNGFDDLAIKDMLRRDGFLPSWKGRKRLSRSDWLAQRRAQKAASEQRRQAEEAKWDEAAADALDLWKRASRAHADNGYLLSKSLAPFGVKQNGSLLLVPMWDARFRLRNIQRIPPPPNSANKRFIPGAQTKGLFWMWGTHRKDGSPTTCPLVIAEGYANAAVIHEATGFAIVAAMTADNLEAVAVIMRATFRSREIILACDYDGHLSENRGLNAAQEAAERIGAALALPIAAGAESDSPTLKIDFADISRAEAAARIDAARNKQGHACN